MGEFIALPSYQVLFLDRVGKFNEKIQREIALLNQEKTFMQINLRQTRNSTFHTKWNGAVSAFRKNSLNNDMVLFYRF